MALGYPASPLIVATNDGKIALLIYRRGSMFTRWVTGYQQISDLSFSYDGDQLAAVGDQGVTVWQVGETEPLYKYPEMVGDRVRFTPDGEGLIVTTTKGAIFSTLMNGDTLSEIVFEEFGNPVFSENGLYFSDGVTVWDGRTAEVVLQLDYTPIWGGQPGIAFSRDGGLIAVGLVGSLEVFIWNIEQKELKLHLTSPNNEALYYTNGKIDHGQSIVTLLNSWSNR